MARIVWSSESLGKSPGEQRLSDREGLGSRGASRGPCTAPQAFRTRKAWGELRFACLWSPSVLMEATAGCVWMCE